VSEKTVIVTHDYSASLDLFVTRNTDACMTEGSSFLNISTMADVTSRRLLKVKSEPISPRHPEVPKTTGVGAIFSRAKPFYDERSPLFLATSERIVFQQDAAFS